MKTINLNQLTSEELAELEQLADHSLFECRNCGNQGTTIKCYNSKKLEELEKERQIICQQEIKRVSSCRNLHIENECLEYSGQYCWHKCWSNCSCWKCNPDNPNSSAHSSTEICPTHWKKIIKK